MFLTPRQSCGSHGRNENPTEDPEVAGVGLELPEGGFGADGFSVEIKDEESKVFTRLTTQLTPQARYAYAQRLFGLFQKKYTLFEDRDEWGNRARRSGSPNL